MKPVLPQPYKNLYDNIYNNYNICKVIFMKLI